MIWSWTGIRQPLNTYLCQTGQWIKGSKQVEVVDIDNKRQSNTHHTWFAASLSGHFLPMQLVYEGKTTKCHPAVKFPVGWQVTHMPNHWCNEETMIDCIESVVVPYNYDTEKKTTSNLKHTRLVNLDKFKGQTTSRVLNLPLQYVLLMANRPERKVS